MADWYTVGTAVAVPITLGLDGSRCYCTIGFWAQNRRSLLVLVCWSSLSSTQCVMALPTEPLVCALEFACVTLKGIGVCSGVCRDWSNASKLAAPIVFLTAPLDVEALCEKLQHQPDSGQVDRIVRHSEDDIFMMDVREFRKIAKLQLLFQHLHKSNRALSLADFAMALSESVGCPTGRNRIVQNALGMLEMSSHTDAILSENIADAIPFIAKWWRRGYGDYCCIGSVLQTTLRARPAATSIAKQASQEELGDWIASVRRLEDEFGDSEDEFGDWIARVVESFTSE